MSNFQIIKRGRVKQMFNCSTQRQNEGWGVGGRKEGYRKKPSLKAYKKAVEIYPNNVQYNEYESSARMSNRMCCWLPPPKTVAKKLQKQEGEEDFRN